MPKELKICMIINCFTPIYAGGALQALRLGRALRQRGVDVFFLTRLFGNMPKKEYIEGIPVYRVSSRGSGNVKGFWFAINSIIFLIRNRHKYNIIHIHGFMDFRFLIIWFGKIFRRPIVVKLTSVGFDSPTSLNRTKLQKIELQNFRFIDVVISTSSALTNSCREAHLDLRKVHQIPNGVDIETFRPPRGEAEKNMLRSNFNLSPSEKLAVYVGRIIKRKGIDIIVEAWKYVVRECKDATLILVGPKEFKKPGFSADREFFKSLDRVIQENQMEGKIKFVGEVKEVDEYLKLSDVFVFPSRMEGCPNALLEAMACGLPAVTLKLPGITEDIIDHKNDGIIIDDEDPRRFAKAIVNLFKDSKLRSRTGENARRKILDHFSLDVISGEYIELYNQLLKREVGR